MFDSPGSSCLRLKNVMLFHQFIKLPTKFKHRVASFRLMRLLMHPLLRSDGYGVCCAISLS